MSRVPGTYANQGRHVRVALAPNPRWTPGQFAKARAGELRPACHDGTPSADVQCPTCSYTQHLHLSQLEQAPTGTTEVGFTCRVCGTVAVLELAPAIVALRQTFGLE